MQPLLLGFVGLVLFASVQTSAQEPCVVPGGLDERCAIAFLNETGNCTILVLDDGSSCEDGLNCTSGDVCILGFCVSGDPVVCDDGNACTDGECSEELLGECVFVSNDTNICDDFDNCTLNDTCVNGTCVGIPVICDDGNLCTDDFCDAALGGVCVFEPNSVACDDFDNCTLNDTCVNGTCVGIPVICDDGNLCTDDFCDAALGGVCVFEPNSVACDDFDNCTLNDTCVNGTCVGIPVICDDGNLCTDDFCDAALGGECVFEPNSVACDDFDNCTLNDTCVNGTCVGIPVICDDGNLCTDDFCDAALGGVCVFEPNSVACDDFDNCTLNDTCVNGTCVGIPVICDDGNLCTDDFCDAALGGECVFEPNSVACDDFDNCTLNDTCVNGTCVGIPVICDDGNLCTDDFCDAALGGVCVFEPNSVACDDFDNCTLNDTCVNGTCVGIPVICDDGNLCTDDFCDAALGGECVFEPNSVACDDFDNCTLNDTCVNGTCVGIPVICDDGNLCTDDFCDAALGGVCVFEPNSVACDDFDNCTLNDTCVNGTCVGIPVICDDGNLCTDDFCDAALGGVCVFEPNSVACDDFDNCTLNDTCVNGTCVGIPVICDDGNLCTDDFCDAALGGVCVFEPNSVACDDFDNCTLNDTCVNGTCVGIPVICDDGNLCTDDFCDAALGGVCVFEPNSVACDDFDNCTLNDTCVNGTCVGIPVICDDGNLCTDDFCDAALGGVCVFEPNSVACDDFDNCTLNDTCVNGTCVGIPVICDDGNLCTDDFCDAALGGVCVFEPNSVACDDFDNCTLNDTCVNGTCVGIPVICDDGNLCTDDFCDAALGGVCVFEPNSVACDDFDNCTLNDTCVNGTCVGIPVICDDGNLCTDDFCDAALGGECVFEPNSVACDDFDNCTLNDTCVNGTCVGIPVICDDGNLCTDDFCDAALGGECVFEPNSVACDDFDNCTLNDTCVNGTCVGIPVICDDGNLCTDDFCDAALGGECVFEPNSVACDDFDNCTLNDTCVNGTCVGIPVICDDGNLCTDDFCDAALGGVCVFEPNSVACDDFDNCTLNDTCVNGTCVGIPVICDDGNLCTDDFCDAALGGVCVFEPNSVACDDFDNCTLNDTCVNGTCVGIPVICDDGNLCTDDFCDAALGGVCVFEPNSVACDDFDNCTLNDTCVNGTCVGIPVICDDGNLCTDDFCDAALGGECVFEPNSVACDDFDICTLNDTCVNGTCGGVPVICEDGLLCTSDFCNGSGLCDAIPVVCDVPEGFDEGCVESFCNEVVGGCGFIALPDNTTCDDGNNCTFNSTCLGGFCIPSVTLTSEECFGIPAPSEGEECGEDGEGGEGGEGGDGDDSGEGSGGDEEGDDDDDGGSGDGSGGDEEGDDDDDGGSGDGSDGGEDDDEDDDSGEGGGGSGGDEEDDDDDEGEGAVEGTDGEPQLDALPVSDGADDNGDDTISDGAAVGFGMGALFLVAAVAGGVLVRRRRRQAHGEGDEAEDEAMDEAADDA